MSLEKILQSALRELPKVIISEAHLAQVLTEQFRNHGYEVFTELRIDLEDSNSKKSYYVDLCVYKQKVASIIELKFKTESNQSGLSGHFLHTDLKFEYKNHKAANLATYSFWKDVLRLEEIKNSREMISHCYAVFVSNDSNYFEIAKTKFTWPQVGLGHSEVLNGHYSFNGKHSLTLIKDYKLTHIDYSNWKSTVVKVV